MKSIITSVIAILLLKVILMSLLIWGIGNFIIWIFDINYTWTIVHGLGTVGIVYSLRFIFGGR